MWTCLSSQILNLFRTLSSWGSGNYRPSASLLYELASHVKQLPFRPLLLVKSLLSYKHPLYNIVQCSLPIFHFTKNYRLAHVFFPHNIYRFVYFDVGFYSIADVVIFANFVWILGDTILISGTRLILLYRVDLCNFLFSDPLSLYQTFQHFMKQRQKIVLLLAKNAEDFYSRKI